MVKKYQDKDWLYNRYWNEELSKQQIADLCNVGKTTIHYWMVKLNILRRTHEEAYNTKDIRERRSEAMHLAQANHCNLSKEAIAFVNGELLGDGCLQSFSAYSAAFAYTFKHYEYAKYISDSLNSFDIKCGEIKERYTADTRGNFHYSYQFCSHRYPELLPFHKKWYPEGKKIVSRDIKLTPLTCLQWYLGDGYLDNRNTPSVTLCTNAFSIDDVEWLIKQLWEIGFLATRQFSRNMIRISTSSTKDFFNYIGECPVECYNYKFDVGVAIRCQV